MMALAYLVLIGFGAFLRRALGRGKNNLPVLCMYRPFAQIMISLQFPPINIRFFAIYRTNCLYHLFSQPSLRNLIIHCASLLYAASLSFASVSALSNNCAA